MSEAALKLEVLGPFSKVLVSFVRAQDTYDLWAGKRDRDLLSPFVIDKVRARAIPIIGNPDAQTLARLSQFYCAVALLIEQRTGIMASPVQQISDEGFGRIVLISGRLVVLSKSLRDVHRFGFASYEKLEADGMAVVDDAVRWIEKFPQAAQAD